MGEEGTWFDYLNRLPFWRHLNAWGNHHLGHKHPWALIFEPTWSLNHVLETLLLLVFVAWGAIAFFRGTKTKDRGLVPPRTMNLRNFFESMTESVFGMVEGAMGEHNAERFFPLIGALWFFILFANCMSLIPGFTTPDDTMKTNLALAGVVFIATHYYGLKEHGLSYFKHFLGPVWWLSWLMLPIELVSHLARPLSLSIRLMGNMIADHKVVVAFFVLFPIIVPVPFILLELLVCLIQALVFCTLTMVYIGMAVEHEEH